MKLVDSSVWIDHFRNTDPELSTLLQQARVVVHPLVTGELLMGSLADREAVAWSLDRLPQAVEASHAEVRSLIEIHKLYSRGIGLVDAHLLASARLMTGTTLLTRDKRLHALAVKLDVS